MVYWIELPKVWIRYFLTHNGHVLIRASFSTHLTTLHWLRKIFGAFSVVSLYAYFVYNVQTHLYSSSFHRRFCSLCTKLIKHVDGWCPITTTCNVSLLNVLTEYDRKSFRLFCCFLSKSKFSNTNPKLINMLIYFSTCPIFQLTWHSIS